MRNLIILGGLAGLAACGSSEAPTVLLPVTTAPRVSDPAMTDLGYQVVVDELRIAVRDIQFTIEGETHTGAARLPPPPHPGHYAGGEVTGELPGDFILRWTSTVQPMLGTAEIIVGDYHGANFTFRAAAATDGLAADDPLLGHAFAMVGTVAKDGTTRPFRAVLDVEADAAVIGAVFDDTITEQSAETLALRFYPTDPAELDTAFDGVDFSTLPLVDGALSIQPGSTAHNVLRRTIQTHDHYGVIAE